MGLLDILDSEDGRFNLGLLMAAAPRATRTTFGERLQDAMGSFDQYKANKLQQQAADLQRRKLKAELDAQEQALEAQRRAREIAAQNPFTLTGGVTPVLQMPSPPQEMGPPTPPPSVLFNGLPPVDSGYAGPDKRPAPPPLLRAPTPPSRPMPQEISPATAMYNHHLKMAGLYSQAGLPDQAQAAMTLAEKFKPEYATEPRVVLMNGKRTNVLIGKDGSVKTMDGMDVPPDMTLVDLGGRKLWQDKNNVQEGDAYKVVPTDVQVDESRRGWANIEIARRAAEEARRNREEGQAGTWAWNEALGTFVNNKSLNTKMPIDPATGKPMQATPRTTEDENKGGGWYMQAKKAFNDMIAAIDPELGGSPKAGKPGWQDAVAKVPGGDDLVNWTRSPARQRFIQATEAFSEAVLRAATGAGVQRAEAIQKVRELTPTFGEDPSVTQQKYRSMQMYLESLRLRSGKNADKVEKAMEPILNVPSGTPGAPDLGKADSIINRPKRLPGLVG